MHVLQKVKWKVICNAGIVLFDVRVPVLSTFVTKQNCLLFSHQVVLNKYVGTSISIRVNEPFRCIAMARPNEVARMSEWTA